MCFRYLLSLEDAICGVASTEYYALAIAHLPRLLPRLLIHAVTYINKVPAYGLTSRCVAELVRQFLTAMAFQSCPAGRCRARASSA